MKKSSRRTFAKQLTGALAATAATSLVAKGGEAPNESQQPRPRMESSHNTPPPLEFINGSFVVENAIEFDDEAPSSNNRRWEYHMFPRTGNVIYAAHVRILKGNGESHEFYDGRRYRVEIELRDANGNDTSSMIINAKPTPNENKFVIDVERNRRFHPGNAANNDRPSSRKRHYRYRHSGAVSEDISMYKITIRDQTNGVVDTINPRTALLGYGKDLRVMIWLEPWPQA